jgi:hypothetical protein
MHDTVYGRARSRAVRTLRSVDDAAVRAVRSRRPILFEAASQMSFDVFQPVYRRRRADPRLDFWFTAPGRACRPTDIFSAVGIEDQVVSADSGRWGKWDLCVNTDFCEMTTLHRAAAHPSLSRRRGEVRSRRAVRPRARDCDVHLRSVRQ